MADSIPLLAFRVVVTSRMGSYAADQGVLRRPAAVERAVQPASGTQRGLLGWVAPIAVELVRLVAKLVRMSYDR